MKENENPNNDKRADLLGFVLSAIALVCSLLAIGLSLYTNWLLDLAAALR